MRPLPVLVLCLPAIAIGFVAGRFTAPPDRSATGSAARTGSEHSGPSASGRPDRRAASASDPAGLMRDAKPGQPHPAFAAAMKQALGNTLESKRLAAWMKLLASMRPEDAPAIHAILQAELNAGRTFPPLATAFWQTWAGLDAGGAWAFVRENEDSGGREGAEAVLKAWSMLDPAKAADAVAELADSPLAQQAWAGLLHGLAESDAAAAIDFVSTRLPEELQEIAAVHITGSMIYQMGNQEAQGWFDELPRDTSPTFIKETARVLMESLSRSEPGSVEKFAMARFDQPWASNRDEQHFAAMLIHRNGGSPWEYIGAAIEKLPDAGDPLSLPKHSAMRQPQQAVAWIDANPGHPSLDPIIGGTALALIQRGEADAAAALISRIKDPAVLQRLGGAP